MPAPAPANGTSLPIAHRILSLDGGGAKGVYSLGFLSRLERRAGRPLNEVFDLIYGTSTGAIIATMLSLGRPVDEIYDLYLKRIPKILSSWFPYVRSRKLGDSVRELLDGSDFSSLKKPTGIVATDWATKRPIIFKSHREMAHSGRGEFIVGHGCSLHEAVCSSCSAVPLFRPVPLSLKARGGNAASGYDGGFCANNPTFFALVDGRNLGFSDASTALFSVGVGHYVPPSVWSVNRLTIKAFSLLPSAKLFGGVLETSSNTTRELQKLLFPNIRGVRVDKAFTEKDLAADLLETNERKLRRLFARGTETFDEQQSDIEFLL